MTSTFAKGRHAGARGVTFEPIVQQRASGRPDEDIESVGGAESLGATMTIGALPGGRPEAAIASSKARWRSASGASGLGFGSGLPRAFRQLLRIDLVGALPLTRAGRSDNTPCVRGSPRVAPRSGANVTLRLHVLHAAAPAARLLGCHARGARYVITLVIMAVWYIMKPMQACGSWLKLVSCAKLLAGRNLYPGGGLGRGVCV